MDDRNNTYEEIIGTIEAHYEATVEVLSTDIDEEILFDMIKFESDH